MQHAFRSCSFFCHGHDMNSSSTPSTLNTEATSVLSREWIHKGTKAYKHAGFALFLVGFASFSLIYCVQPLLPAFSQSFQISPASSSLALSLTTAFLAISIVLSSAFSQAIGRRGVIFTSMLCAAILNIVSMLTPNWHSLLMARALEGLLLGGVPAVTMAWIAEEIAPEHLGKTMGLYIAGTAFGGMMGRVGMGILVEYFSWRTALGLLGAICFICSIAFLKLLPVSRNFVQKKGLNLGFHMQMWRAHLSNTKLLRLFAIGFLLTSVFVTLFNYATFRLSGAPYSLSQTQISLIFLSYSFGMVSSSLAGSLADRFGKKTMMMSGFALMIVGSLMTLLTSLFGIIIGIAFITTGFFITHSLTSSSVGTESKQAKAHASSLYLLFYYMGSSIVGSAGGWFWLHGGWSAIVGLTVVLSLIGIFLAVYTSHAKAH